MLSILLLCGSLLMAHNNYLCSTEQHIGEVGEMMKNADAYALSCTINLIGCKQHQTHIKKLSKTFLPSLLNTKKFDNINYANLSNGFKACLFNEEATITLHVVGDNVYVEVTNSTPFNPYLIGAYLANFYKAQYFSCTVVLR